MSSVVCQGYTYYPQSAWQIRNNLPPPTNSSFARLNQVGKCKLFIILHNTTQRPTFFELMQYS